jgi:hypothetical protein
MACHAHLKEIQIIILFISYNTNDLNDPNIVDNDCLIGLLLFPRHRRIIDPVKRDLRFASVRALSPTAYFLTDQKGDIFMSFLLDQKGPKNQGPTEICLSSLRNSGKKYFSTKFLRLLFFIKFLNGRKKNI